MAKPGTGEIPLPPGGVSLSRLMTAASDAGTPIATPLAVRIVASACERLHAAHTRRDDGGRPLGLVHGSLSPHFILVLPDGSVQIAKSSPEWEALGYRYRSHQPGGPDPGSAQADIFALGLVLHELVAGALPEEAPATPEMPEPLRAVVMKATAAAPADRFADARAMQLALEQLLATPGMASTNAEVARLVSAHPAPTRRPRRDIEAFFGEDGAVLKPARSPAAVEIFSQLLDLGFTRLGIKWEVNRATGSRVPAVVFASAAKEAFAGVFFIHDALPALYFTTPFQDGRVVLTGCYDRPETRTDWAVLSGVDGRSLPEVLEVHRREVRAMKEAGHLPCSEWGREAQLAATQAYYSNPDV
jgi:hypothetical protein